MSDLTREEFLKKYGEVEVKFSYYYKYEFVFKGEVDGSPIAVSIGGSADGIYGMDVSFDETSTVSALMPYKGECGEDNFFDFPDFY